MAISHDLNGGRRVRIERGDHTVLVSQGRGGYIQRPPFVAYGHTYVQRTYVRGGAVYARVYRPFAFRGIELDVYAHPHFFGLGFYAWAGTPWPVPVHYRWDFSHAPGCACNASYFAPEPVYPGAPLWLSDYVMANSLQQGYQDASESGAAGTQACTSQGQTPVSSDVKQAISGEVSRQIQQEQAEAATGAAASILDGRSHVLVASASLIADAGDQQCAISSGDVVYFSGASAVNGANANIQMLASKGVDCAAGSFASVALDQLQEMQNRMAETIDQGLAYLRSQQGKGGLPILPASAMTAPADAPVAAAMPAPDPNAAQELQQESQDATQAEQEAVNETTSSPTAGPNTITLGQTVADVEKALGAPAKAVDLGAKQLYIYQNLKVTFVNGRVSDVM